MSLVFNISQNKKNQRTFLLTVQPVPSVQPVQPVQPVPPVTTRAGALVVRVEHWTPKGDCTERGDKERSDQKKVHQKNYEIFSQKASLAVM